jgi:sulfate/thiosulfate transport system substrate-binding protein
MATLSTGIVENVYCRVCRLTDLTLEKTLNTRILGAGALAIAALIAAGCGGAADTKDATAATGSGTGAKLALVAYSTPQVVYDELTPKFAATPAGRGTAFTASYGASGDQSRAVDSGLPADVVAFSLAPDITRLVKDGLVAPDWTSEPHNGIVTDSVTTFVVRKGNPKHIRTWADLLKPGVQVLTPNPFTSGGARWNIMAAYGAQLKLGRTPAQALAYLRELFTKHVPVQDKSARDALQTFTGGKGDVLLSYENEAITARQKGEKVDYHTPDQTILIENPVAVTKNAKPQARAFLRYLWTPAAQAVFAKHGYRPVVAAVARRFSSRFAEPKTLFTIDDLGGWDKVMTDFFDPANGAVAKIEQDAGVSTAK